MSLLTRPQHTIVVTPVIVKRSPLNGSMVYEGGEPIRIRCNVQPAAVDNLNRSSSTIFLEDGVKPLNMMVVYCLPGVYPNVLHARVEYDGEVYHQKGRLTKQRQGTRAVWHDQITITRGNDIGEAEYADKP